MHDEDSDHEGEERDSDNDEAELPIVYDDIVDFAPAQAAESNVPLSDQAAVDAEALQWANLWQHELEYVTPRFDIPLETLSDILPLALQESAATFPIDTGVGADNIAPRAYLRLSNAAIRTLAALLTALEKIGAWPSALNLVLIVLLPKTDGGLRPIGLFQGPTRLWFRTRLRATRVWEHLTALPSIFGGPGKGAQAAAHQVAFAAENAALTDNTFGASLLDLVKAFESVPHAILAAAAIYLGYPLFLLRLCLASYRLKRSIGVDGVYSREVVATRGITAGSGTATTELRLLMLDVIQTLHLTWASKLIVKLYVDDLTLAACGCTAFVVKTLIDSTNLVIHMLENKLGMNVSAKKSVVVSSLPTAAVAIAEGIETKKVSPTFHAKGLGADIVGGSKRCTQQQRKRLKVFSDKRESFHSLRQAGGNTQQIARAVGPPSTLYTVDCFGISNAALQQVRSSVAASASTDTAGKNPDAVLYAIDGQFGTLDPAFDAHALPIKQWAQGVWDATYSHEDLMQAISLARIKIDRAKGSPWSVVTGPAAALLLTLDRIGWKLLNPFCATDHRGQRWHFGKDPPAAITKAVHHSVRAWRLRRLMVAFPALEPSHFDVCTTSDDAPSIMVDFGFALKTLFKGKPAKAYARWLSSWAPYLVSALSGGQWTQTRKAKIAKWMISDSNCQLCKKQPGTAMHRFTCEASKPEHGYTLSNTAALELENSLCEGRRILLRTRALFVAKLPAPTPREDGDFHWVVDPTAKLGAHTETIWYCDGSLVQGRWLPFRAAGFGVVVVTPCGQLLGFGFGSPPSQFATAASAELWAVSFALASTPFAHIIKTDCKSILISARAGKDRVAHHSRPLARIWNQIAATLDDDIGRLANGNLLVWIPAHTTLASVGEARASNGARFTTLDWRANRLADILAKIGAERYKSNDATETFLTQATDLVRQRACHLAEATYTANNFQQEFTKDDGTIGHHTIRDSVSKPKVNKWIKKARLAKSANPKTTPTKAKRTIDMIAAWKPPPPPTKQARLAAATREANLKRARITNDILDDKAKHLTPTEPDSAQLRRQQLRQRLEAKWAANSAAASAKVATSTTTDATAATANIDEPISNPKNIIVDKLTKADAKNWIHNLREHVLRRYRNLTPDDEFKHAAPKKQKVIDTPSNDISDINHNPTTASSSSHSLSVSSHFVHASPATSLNLVATVNPSSSSPVLLETPGEQGQGECIGGKSHPHPSCSPRVPKPLDTTRTARCSGISTDRSLATLVTNSDTAPTSHSS